MNSINIILKKLFLGLSYIKSWIKWISNNKITSIENYKKDYLTNLVFLLYE